MFRCSVQIMGGLGNKLFQIAMLIGYSMKNLYEPLIINSRVFRNFQTITDWQYFIRDIERVDTAKFVEVREPIDKTGKYVEFPQIRSDIIFDGYFQTEKYFIHCRDIILKQFKCPIDRREILLKTYPGLVNGVFFHLRFGDSYRDQKSRQVHWIDLTEFRRRSLRYFPVDATFFIFSDELDTSRDDIIVKSLPKKVFVDANEVDSLWCMSLCRYGGICSNSTFSWWGGWLNECRDRKIIFPDKFITDEKNQQDDLISSTFIIEKTT